MLAVGTSGVVSALVDLKTRRIPNPLTMGIAALGVGLAAAGMTGVTATQAVLGFGVGLVFMLPGYLIGATGGGDVKFFAALGTLLGPRAMGHAFVYAVIAGGLLAVVVALRRRQLRDTLDRAAVLMMTRGGNVTAIEGAQNNRFAYAPAIAAGALVKALGW